MAKKSSEAIMYTVLAILTVALLAWLWSKHTVTLASIKAAATAGAQTVALTPSNVESDVLIAPAGMTDVLTNTSAPL